LGKVKAAMKSFDIDKMKIPTFKREGKANWNTFGKIYEGRYALLRPLHSFKSNATLNEDAIRFETEKASNENFENRKRNKLNADASKKREESETSSMQMPAKKDNATKEEQVRIDSYRDNHFNFGSSELLKGDYEFINNAFKNF
jgi:hypothetical protein